MNALSLTILMFLLYAGIICIFHRVKLSRLAPEDFPHVDKGKFLRWKQIEVKRVRIFLWISWVAFVLQIALANLPVEYLSHLSRGDEDQLETIVMVIQLLYFFGSFSLMIACLSAEGDEQKKLRVEAHVESFYQPAPPIPPGELTISVEPFAAEIDITHVLGLKSESLRFMSNTTIVTKTYRPAAGLSLCPPNGISLASGRAHMKKSVSLTCPHCGEKLASYVNYAVYARIPRDAIRGDSALKTSVWKYIMTHRFVPYWIFFLGSSTLTAISAGFLLRTTSPFLLSALLFAIADIGLFAIFVGLMGVFIDSNIRRRDTLIRFPEVTRRATPILAHSDTRPLICVSGIKIESAQGGSHELKIRTSERMDSWGSSTVGLDPATYGSFGLINPYIPEVDW